MNNNSKLLAAVVVAALAFAVFPTTQAQNAGTDYGTQVLETENEFRPTLEAGTAISAGNVIALWAQGESATTFTDDIVILDLGNGAGGAPNGLIDRYDYILYTGGFDGSAIGDLVSDSMTALLALTEVDTTVNVVYADVNENGFYDEGDYVYLTTAADGVGAPGNLAATVLGGTFTIRLTENGSGDFGSFVRTTDDDFQDYGTGMVSNDFGDFDGLADDVSGFAFYDSENDGEFEGGADRAFITPGVTVAAGATVPLYSILIFGGELGEQVGLDSMLFSPTLTVLVDVVADNCVRFDANTAQETSDDIIVLDTNDDGNIDQHEIVLATGTGYGGSAVGTPVGLTQTLLIGNGVAVTCAWFFADVDENGFFNEGDYVFVCDVDTNLHRTDSDEFCVRITDTSGGNAGSFVRIGDADLRDWDTSVEAGDADADVGFLDFDLDTAYTGRTDERVWLDFSTITAGDTVSLYSIVLAGPNFGDLVGIGDADFVPTLTVLANGVVETSACVRYDSGTNNDFVDDVIGLDMITDDGDFDQYELIIFSGDSDHTVGDVVRAEDLDLLGNGANVACFVVFVDANENGFYDGGDWVYITTTDDDIAATTTAAFSVRMTETDGGASGTIVRTTDSDRRDWAAIAEGNTAFGAVAELGFYDNDADGVFQGSQDGDLLFLTPVNIATGDRVPLYSLRLFGDFSIVPQPGGTTTTTGTTTTGTTTTGTTTTGTTTTGTTTTGTTTTGTTTTGGTTTPGDGTTTPTDGDDTPGFGIVALLAALGAALVLVRRKL